MFRSAESRSSRQSWTEFLTTRKTELLRKIATEKAVSSAVVADLKAAAEEFKQTWK